MEKATEILDVSDSKEFAEFYNMRSNLDDQLKFVRALSYNRYNGKIYKGAEKFMPIDFCIAKAIELDNPKLV